MFIGTLLANMSNKIRVTILGDSMNPTFKNGDKIIFEELNNQKISPDDLILCYHPYISNKKIVKRVKNITVNGNILSKGIIRKAVQIVEILEPLINKV